MKKEQEVVVYLRIGTFVLRRLIDESLMSVEFPKNLKLPDTTEYSKPSSILQFTSKISDRFVQLARKITLDHDLLVVKLHN